jgi:hypothetical protein
LIRPKAEAQITWRQSARETALKGFLISLALFSQPAGAAATEGSASARPPVAVLHDEEPIPVATDAGVVPMSQRDYEGYVKSMGHLPVMSQVYVFGNKIPLPKTDKAGHIHLSGPAPAVPPRRVNRVGDTSIRPVRQAPR